MSLENEFDQQKDDSMIFYKILDILNGINNNLGDLVIEVRDLKEEIKTGVVIFK